MRSSLTGLEIGSDEPATAAAIDDLTIELLRYGDGSGRLFTAAAADPDCAIVNALAAALHLFTMSRAGAERAAPHLAKARAAAVSATAREQCFIAAIGDWAAGQLTSAIDRHLAILQRWPTDLLSLKLVTYHQLNRGDFAAMLQTIKLALPANRRHSHVCGMHAFALSQVGRHREAEAAGRGAVTAGCDPWAQHAVAHVLDRAGAHDEGAAFMAAHAAGWERCSSFLYTHNWWHAALFDLARGDAAGALRLFDDRVWSRRRDHVQDQVNAVALLARLDLAGVDVGDRWSCVADHVDAGADDHRNGFVDLHQALALARAGREARLDAMLGDLQQRAFAAGDEDRERTATHAAAARGLAAYGQGDFQTAARHLGSARPHLIRLGGSDVQREMFDLILIQCLRACGRLADAAAMDNARHGRRAEAAWQRRAMAGCVGAPEARHG